MNQAPTPRREIDLRDVHAGQIPSAVLALFDEGALSDRPIILLPDYYRIFVAEQTRAELYHLAVEIGGYVGMARLTGGRH